MKTFFVALAITIFSITNIIAQDYNYQGYVKNSNGTDSARGSFYIAGNQFDPMTVFNPSNYPIWFKENVTVQLDNGILNYTLVGVNTDSLIQYRGQLYLYVTLNGSPFDKVLISAVPYSTYSEFADNSNYAISADTALFSIGSQLAQRAINSDSADFANVSLMSDSAKSAAIANVAITAFNSLVADSAFTVANESITAEKIADNSVNPSHFNTVNAASNQTSLSFIDGNFVWATRDYVNTTTVQKSLVVPTSINDQTLYFISQVAQDYSIVEPTVRYGRLIRIVNASTANVITVNWNTLFGGVVFIGPRTSVEFMYVGNEWIKL